jgi:hypothetical protein
MEVEEAEVTENNEWTLVIGEEYVEEAVEEQVTEATEDDHRYEVLTRDELRQIQEDIRKTIRPSWHRGPPTNLGEPGHGKLKADQWRSCIEFDLPVSLAQLWSGANSTKDGRGLLRRRLVHSTMLLAMAIRWATSHRTSQDHADQYTIYIRKYLESLIDIYPTIQLRPNHHVALHIGEYLLRFGPSHGWWMFPFERLIGFLQQVNTNHKIGKRCAHDRRWS